MRRLKFFGLAVVAVFASAAAMSTSAMALSLPEILPISGSARTWTGASEGATEFKGSLGTVTCETATAEGNEEAGKPLGAFHIHFSKCALGTTTCTGSGESAGVILTLGTWHLVFDLNGSGTFELTTATLFLVELTTFSCGALVKSEVKGEQLCLDLKPTESSKTHSFHCVAEGTKQTDKWCKSDSGTACVEPVEPVLLTSINKAAFKESAELALGNATYEEAISGDI